MVHPAANHLPPEGRAGLALGAGPPGLYVLGEKSLWQSMQLSEPAGVETLSKALGAMFD